MNKKRKEKWNGHLNIGKHITVFGDNAMHYAIEIWTKKYGCVVFRPTTGRGCWKWYLYCSPVATPWAATFAIGPGIQKRDKELAPIRKKMFGHNFILDECHDELFHLNGIDGY
jgi:hypothetical protein